MVTPTQWYSKTDDGRILCQLCPRACRMKDGDRGFCFVRKNEGGKMVLDTYGKSTGFCIDPIEKKASESFFAGDTRFEFRDGGLQPGLQVLSELGHLEEP